MGSGDPAGLRTLADLSQKQQCSSTAAAAVEDLAQPKTLSSVQLQCEQDAVRTVRWGGVGGNSWQRVEPPTPEETGLKAQSRALCTSPSLSRSARPVSGLTRASNGAAERPTVTEHL